MVNKTEFHFQEKRIYQSNVDLLYGYSFKNGYRKPRLYTTRTHTAPQRSTAISKLQQRLLQSAAVRQLANLA